MLTKNRIQIRRTPDGYTSQCVICGKHKECHHDHIEKGGYYSGGVFRQDITGELFPTLACGDQVSVLDDTKTIRTHTGKITRITKSGMVWVRVTTIEKTIKVPWWRIAPPA
jgi:hypothetical protein